MLRVTIDAFSGRPDPSYVLEDAEARDLLRDVSRQPELVAEVDAGFDGLGFRGVVIESLSDDTQDTFGLPQRFKVAGGSSANAGNALDLAERLIRALPTHQPYAPAEDAALAADGKLVDYLLQLLTQTRTVGTQTVVDRPAVIETAPEDVTCLIERSVFNPGFWNNPSVISRNNCYNYASNWRTNTFAQPGRGAGQMYRSISCAEVSRGALADGCHRRFDCFPDSEAPRRLVALVIAPGFDYHWYRIHSAAEGFWGHKPGATAARNTDNSGRLITNPEVCDRGPYTQFCGYFYTCKSQANRIR